MWMVSFRSLMLSLDVDAEVEAYRQELLAQKKAEAAASATAGSAAG